MNLGDRQVNGPNMEANGVVNFNPRSIGLMNLGEIIMYGNVGNGEVY